MGYQSQEQRIFLGLYTRQRGATAPRFTAAEVKNVDFQFESIKGRDPSERIVSGQAPQHALYFDGRVRYAETDYADTDFSLELQTNVAEVSVDIYFGGLDLNKLSEHPDDTRWFLAGSTGASTDFGLGTGQVEGWAIMLRKTTSGGDPTIHLEAHWVEPGPANGSLQIADFQQYWSSAQDAFLVRFEWDGNTENERSLRLAVNGATTFAVSASSATTLNILRVAGTMYLTVGAFRDMDGAHSHLLEGTVASVQIWDGEQTTTSEMWKSFNEGHFDGDAAPTLLWLLQPDRGEGYQQRVLGDTGWTNAGAGLALFHPRPPVIVSGRLELEAGAHAEVDASVIRTNASKSWGAILEFRVPTQALDFTNPPWIATASDSSLVMPLNASVGGDFEVRCNVGTVGSTGAPANTVSLVTASNLVFDTTYKIAVVLKPRFDSLLTDGYLFVNIAGVWSLADSDLSVVGTPDLQHRWIFSTNESHDRTLDLLLESFRLFNNFEATPTLAADITALDVYPGDTATTIGFPDRLAVSIDASQASFVDTETTADGDERVTRIRDNFSGVFQLRTRPELATSPWAALAYMTRGKKQAVYGCVPSVVHVGETTRNYLNFVLPGGVWRYDQQADTGEWFQHHNFTGAPVKGARGLHAKGRAFIFGEGFAPVKIHPRGSDFIGLPRPTVTLLAASPVSSNGDGGLDESTTYVYRASIYNSQTGQESNLSYGSFSFATAAGHDTIHFTVEGVNARGAEDWDAIRLYRRGQTVEIYHLEMEIPRPKLLPPDGDSITLESKLPEFSLILQFQEEIDNDPPIPFVCAAEANSQLIAGGAGPTPGWAIFSKPGFMESFPPLNIWQLDNDHGNPVLAIVRVFSRILIIKERGIWGAPEDAGETGVQPQQLHTGQGLASAAAWTAADNVIFWLSNDRKVYATDGLEVEDISSPTIKETMRLLTDDELAGVQACYDARSGQVWFLIPRTDSLGLHSRVLVFSHDTRRWTEFEIPCDSINSAHDSAKNTGQYAVIGRRGYALRLVDGVLNYEDSGVGSPSISIKTYDSQAMPDPFLLDADGIVAIAVGGAIGDPTTWEGVPVTLVPHDTAFEAGVTDPAYVPFLDEPAANIVHGYLAGGSDGATKYIYLGQPFDLGAFRYLSIAYAMQIRIYRSHWIAPQGEDRPYLFFGTTLVQDELVTAEATLVRHFHDHSTTPSGSTFAASTRLTGNDRSFEVRRRGRRFQFLLYQGVARGEELHFRRATWRYQVRGPARRRGA